MGMGDGRWERLKMGVGWEVVSGDERWEVCGRFVKNLSI